MKYCLRINPPASSTYLRGSCGVHMAYIAACGSQRAFTDDSSWQFVCCVALLLLLLRSNFHFSFLLQCVLFHYYFSFLPAVDIILFLSPQLFVVSSAICALLPLQFFCRFQSVIGLLARLPASTTSSLFVRTCITG